MNEFLLDIIKKYIEYELKPSKGRKIERYTTEEIVDAVAACNEEQGKPCTCDALVCCTSADDGESVHIVKEENGITVKIANKKQLDKRDIKREQIFETGCRRSVDGICVLDEMEIRDGIWKESTGTFDMGEDMEGLDSEESYMICDHGPGVIFFKDAGQDIRESMMEKSDELFYDEIIDIKSKLYELAVQGGMETIEDFLDEYLTPDIRKYLDGIAQRESSGEIDKKTETGTYFGKYQFCYDTLIDIGWCNKGTGVWTENAKMFGVESQSDFLNNETAQDVAIILYLRYMYMYHDNEGTTGLIGETIHGYVKENNADNKSAKKQQDMEVTLSGLLAASHLVGIGAVKNACNAYMNEFSECYNIEKLLGYVHDSDDVGFKGE